jgi:hypothetical protein
MAMELIRRLPEGTTKETISRFKLDAPQIAYNSEGRITVRVPQINGDMLLVFDRPLSRELIRFVKNGVTELPESDSFCRRCAEELNNGIPF